MTRPRYQTRIITLLFVILVMTSAACAQFPFRNSYDETIPNNVPLPTVTPPASPPDQMEHLPISTLQPLALSVLQTAEPSPAVPLPAEPSTADSSPNEILPAESSLPIDSIVPSATIIPRESPPPAPTEYVPVSINVSPSHLDESFAQAMRADFVQDIANYADSMPRYHLRFHIYPAEGTLEGRALVEFPNTTGAPLDSVVLRLYPNFPRDAFGNGGNTRMDVGNVRVAGQPALKSYLADDTAIMIPFSVPLQPGNWTLLEIEFTATFVPWQDGNWPLPSYYPMLAVYDHPTATWRTDVTEFVDRVFAESAFYSAEITIPAHLTLVASGNIVDTQLHDDHGTATYHVRTGPMREFAMVVGNLVSVQLQGGDSGDVTVTVYKVAGSDLDIDQVAYVAATSITNYDRRYGRYPFNELDAYVLRGGYRGGWEYPGMFLLSCETHIDAGRRYVTAHEVSHQWWYNVVGNDVYRHPWLDEALAQYSGIIYAEDVAGADVANADWEREVNARYQPALASGDLPIGWGIHDYPNFDVYFYTVYGKGAVFMRTLRSELGDDAFFGGLQRYYSQNRYRIGQPYQLQQAFEEASGRDLQGLFTSWVYGH